jgi:hypothetical protein
MLTIYEKPHHWYVNSYRYMSFRVRSRGASDIFFCHLSELAWIYKVLGSIPHSSHYFFTAPFLAEVVPIVFLLDLF